MNTNVGESLIHSWLKYDKACQIIQDNWRPSKKWRPADTKSLLEIAQKSNDIIYNEINKKIFFDDDFVTDEKFEQKIKATECDLIGMDFAGKEKKIFLVEVAFHEKGVHYNKNGENATVETILAKIVRNVICAYAFLSPRPEQKIHSYFVSPIAQHQVCKQVTQCIEKLNKMFSSLGKNVELDVYFNVKFKSDILQSLMVDIIPNHDEVFLRSVKLLDLFALIPNNTQKTCKISKRRREQCVPQDIQDPDESNSREQSCHEHENLQKLQKWRECKGQRNAIVVNEFLHLLSGKPEGSRSVALDEFQKRIDSRYNKHISLTSFSRPYRNNDAYIFDLDNKRNTCTITEQAWAELHRLNWQSPLD